MKTLFPVVARTADFVVINKPAGVAVHKDESEDEGLTSALAQQLGVEQVWLVHRLDKSTSGLLLLALNAEAASHVATAFAEHQVEKYYVALSQYKPKKKQGLIKGDMERSRRGMWKLTHTTNNPAITRFYSVSCEPNLRLFVLKPQTGRTHQLRVAMKSLGSPILGDPLYGDKKAADRCYLHAALLSFSLLGNSFCYTCMPEGEYFMHDSVQQQLKLFFAWELGNVCS